MLTTPLLSLSVHEALTFDGTEIALHPDLFNDSSGNVNSGSSVVTAATRVRPPNPSAPAATSTPAPVHRHTKSDTAAAAAAALAFSALQLDKDGKATTTNPEESKALTPTSLSRQASHLTVGSTSDNRLEVGNMIEIRVWDPLPCVDKRRSNSTSPSGGLRRRSSPPSVSTKGQIDSSYATAATLEAAASSLQMSFPSSNASLQYSMESSDAPPTEPSPMASKGSSPNRKDTDGTGTAADGSTLSSGDKNKEEAVPEVAANTTEKDDVPHTVIAPNPARSAAVPPLFPRSRSNTGDAPPPRPINPSTTQHASKPPTVQRNRTSSSLPAGRHTPTASASSQPTSKPRSLHVRDISDMTADTIAYASGAFGPLATSSTDHHQHAAFNVSGSDIISGMPSMESGEDGATIDDDQLSKVSTTHQLRLSFTMLVTEKTLTSIKGSARTQVSILRQVADLYNLSSYDMVTVTKIENSDEPAVLEEVSADFVMVTIKDQFISRGDMHYFQKTLLGRWIYEGERLSQSKTGVKAHAREIRHANRLARSGIITTNSTITFRSRSARIIWLVQISSEMWDYASPYETEHGQRDDESSCEIYFDKFVSFMYSLFEKWKELEVCTDLFYRLSLPVTHSLTVVFFSRTFLAPKKPSESDSEAQPNRNVDIYGRVFEDHYKTVVENETPSDWDSLVVRIKREFVAYPFDVGWNLSSGDGWRRPSNAMQGNLLEAINVTLNLLHFHFMDRDLQRTGNSIVIVSPGCGVFEVDRGLSEITYQRMMDDGIGSDMLSLGLPPLHIAPFFLYNNDFFSVDTHGVDAGSTYYEVPHWMHLSFASYQKDETGLSTGSDLIFFKANGAVEGSQSYPQVAANGFLLPKHMSEPRVAAESSLRSKLTEDSVNVGGSTSKTQTHTKQRALISGRDFEDILEACRPRDVANSVPSALFALLQMHHQVEESIADCSQSEVKKLGRTEQDTRALSVGSDMSSAGSEAVKVLSGHSTKDRSNLMEWGAIDVNETEGGTVRSHQIRSESESPLLPLESTDHSESSDKSSPSSSFASVYSHMLGKPPERGSSLGSYHHVIHSLGGIQMQRSPSLEFEPYEDTGGVETTKTSPKDATSQELLSTIGSLGIPDYKLLSSPTRREGAMVPSSANENAGADYAEQVRDLISKRDANFFLSTSKSGKHTISDTFYHAGAVIGTDSSPARNRSTHYRELPTQKKGGLGAALLQYNKSSDQVVGNSSTDNIKRIRSVGMMSPGPLSGTPQGSLSPALVGMPLGSDPPEHIQFHRYRSQGMIGDVTIRNLLTPDGKAIQRLDGIPQTRPVGTPGNFSPLAASAPSDNLIYPPTNQTATGYNRQISRNSGASIRLGTSKSPPVESNVIEKESAPNVRETLLSNQEARGRKRHKRYGQNREGSKAGEPVSRTARSSRQMKSAFNPFREHDEEEVLAKKTHNRRRWSHVFPIGEIEFKRHAGPNWRSLCQPAILPLTIDVHPSPQELKDRNKFYFSHYSITLSAIDRSYYTSNEELLLEMVRQRVTQDFQIVPPSVINESTRRGEAERKANLNRPGARRRGSSPATERHSPFLPANSSFIEDEGTIQHTLSIGHKIHELTYHPSSDSVEVIQYYGAFAMHDTRDVYNYRYHLFSESTKKFSRVVQTFQKYPYISRWNKVDNIICGDSENLSEEMRYRRVSFGLIPEEFSDEAAEEEYVGKFKRLLDYLSRLRQTEDVSNELDIRIISGNDSRPDRTKSTYRVRGFKESMRRFVVHLRKGKEDRYEWMELGLDPTFDTRRSYRIMVNWLVASANKVETQVQLLQRRCTQYGLKLVSFPQLSTSENIFLHPFQAPLMIAIRDAEKAKLLDDALVEKDFVDDGVHRTGPQFMDCIDGIDEFDFPPRNIQGQQYVHRSGALFIRLLRDLAGKVILVALENTRHIGRGDEMRKIADTAFRDVWNYVESLNR